MSPSLAVSSPSLRCAAIVAILLSGVLPDILLKLAAATCSTSSSSSDPYSFSRSANFHPDFPPKSWTSLTRQTTQKTIAGGKKNSQQLLSRRNRQYKFTLRPRTRTLSVCLCRKQSLCVRHRCADPSLRRFHTTTESVCSFDLEQNLSLSQALCASLSLSASQVPMHRSVSPSILSHQHCVCTLYTLRSTSSNHYQKQTIDQFSLLSVKIATVEKKIN
jgi:hypothetical protein